MTHRQENKIIVRRLSPADTADYRRIRLRGLREFPSAFGSSYSEEKKRPLAAFKQRLTHTPDTWALGAFADGRLVGVLSLVRETKKKERHKASLFGLYVDGKMRRQGIGRALLTYAVETARHLRGLRQVRISAVDSNRPAVLLYRSAGFTEYGKEEAALFVGGKYYSELFMVLRL